MKRKNIFWGIALIAIAVIWIITKLDIFPGVQFGKIAFTLLWAAWLVKGILDRGFFVISLFTCLFPITSFLVSKYK